jgi:hypothetical protein
VENIIIKRIKNQIKKARLEQMEKCGMLKRFVERRKELEHYIAGLQDALLLVQDSFGQEEKRSSK